MKIKYWVAFLLVMSIFSSTGLSFESGGRALAYEAVSADTAGVDSNLSTLGGLNSAFFIENVGQFVPDVRFQIWGPESSVQLLDDGLWVSQFKSTDQPAGDTQDRHLRLRFVGANPEAALIPFHAQSTQISYFLGSDSTDWYTDVPVWAGVRYQNLYPGIDLEVMAGKQGFAPRLVVRPGAKLNQVQLEVTGGDDLQLTGNSLQVTAGRRQIDLPLLRVVDTAGHDWPGKLVGPVLRDMIVQTPFASGSPALAAPAASGLNYSTFLGGSLSDQANGIFVDGSDQVYITGSTVSSNFFPTGYKGPTDAFILKLNSSGTNLVYGIFLGGTSFDQGDAVTVDGSGIAYVVGRTDSPDFPVTAGAYDGAYSAERDVFLAKVNAAGNALTYATFLGGSDRDEPEGIALHTDGTVYVTGLTESPDFPVTPGVLQSQLGDDIDAFVTRFNTTGIGLIYSTYLGGNNDEDTGRAIAVDSEGRAYIAGQTFSSNFPVTSGAFDTSWGNGDGFLARLNAAGSALEYSVFLGGDTFDNATGIALNPTDGSVYVTGSTLSSDFPTTANAFDQSFNGLDDAFVVRIDTTKTVGTDLVFGTYLGGNGFDLGTAVVSDNLGNVYLAGQTSSDNLPTVAGSLDETYNGGDTDGFFARLTPDGKWAYVSYLGGDSSDVINSLGINADGEFFLTGTTNSTTNFPIEPGSYSTNFNGIQDAFATHLSITSENVDMVISGSEQRKASSSRNGLVIIQYGNLGGDDGDNVKITATLDSHLQYKGSTLALPHKENLSGNQVTWSLTDSVKPLAGSSFAIELAVDPPAGGTYPIQLTISSDGPESDPASNNTSVMLRYASEAFLPFIAASP